MTGAQIFVGLLLALGAAASLLNAGGRMATRRAGEATLAVIVSAPYIAATVLVFAAWGH